MKIFRVKTCKNELLPQKNDKFWLTVKIFTQTWIRTGAICSEISSLNFGLFFSNRKNIITQLFSVLHGATLQHTES